ncbi:hypothetical protein PG993_000070 [Apiospora rasikravindrae]|uniref:Uncharacterized protein n=1 Tax=Apiospora rasikravindrae TaxID=990691 RepID=A0ABR1UA79_9PEZI
MRLSLLSVFVAGIIAPALCHPTDVAATDDDDAPAAFFTPARVVEMQWQVEVAPGRVEILNGTIEEAIRAAQDINPEFQFGLDDNDDDEEEDGSGGSIASYNHHPAAALSAGGLIGIASDNDPLPGEMKCYPNEKNAALVKYLTWQAVPHLRKVTGPPPVAGPGPDTCSRVSCSHHAAVFICNDKPEAVTLPSWNYVSRVVQEIAKKCRTVLPFWKLRRAKGDYHENGWYIRVEKVKKKC